MLTQQSFVDKSLGEPKSTVPVILSSGNDIRSQMTNFFATSVFPATISVVYSTPFYDAIDTDLSISLCLPVLQYGRLKGTVCVDATISELFNEVQYFQQSTAAYVFLMDGLGRLLLHPLLPVPQSTAPYATPVSLTLIEHDLGGNIQQLQQNMIEQISGSMKILSRQVFPRGQSELTGIDINYLPSTYYWHKVSSTNMTVCLVITDGYVNTSISSLDETFHPVVFFDEVLFKNQSMDMCDFGGQSVALRNKSSVHLAPNCFNDPQLYLDQPTSSSLYASWTSFLEGRESTSLDIKSNIPDAVDSTYILDSFWAANPSDIIIGRYIGLREGVFRHFPGELFPKQYDPTSRGWYRQAVANPNIYAIYGPYQHASINLCVISVASAITKQLSLFNSSTIIGVLSMSLTLAYFNQVINESAKSCSKANERCFVIDQSGFVVMYQTFAGQIGDCANITDQHITCLEGAIAQDMILRQILVRSKCISYVYKNSINFWKISIPNGVTTGPYYDIYSVPETNIYVVQVHTALNLQSYVCDCLAQSESNSIQGTCSETTSSNTTTCEYPCFTETQYSQLCRGQLTYGDGESPCMPPAPVWTLPPLNLTGYLATLCSCDSNCTSTAVQTSPVGPNLLPLLVLLVLLLIPIVAIAIFCLRKPGKPAINRKEKKKKTGDHTWTDSDAYKKSHYVSDFPLGSDERVYHQPQLDESSNSANGDMVVKFRPEIDGISQHGYESTYDTLNVEPEINAPSGGGPSVEIGDVVNLKRNAEFENNADSQDSYLTVFNPDFSNSMANLPRRQVSDGPEQHCGDSVEIVPPVAHVISNGENRTTGSDGSSADHEKSNDVIDRLLLTNDRSAAVHVSAAGNGKPVFQQEQRTGGGLDRVELTSNVTDGAVFV